MGDPQSKTLELECPLLGDNSPWISVTENMALLGQTSRILSSAGIRENFRLSCWLPTESNRIRQFLTPTCLKKEGPHHWWQQDGSNPWHTVTSQSVKLSPAVDWDKVRVKCHPERLNGCSTWQMGITITEKMGVWNSYVEGSYGFAKKKIK